MNDSTLDHHFSQRMMRMRTAAFVIAGFLLLAGATELRAQERDTSTTRAPAFPRPAKAKGTVAPPRAPTRATEGALKGVAPPKTKSAPAPRRADSLPAITKPPKESRPPA